MVLPIIWVVMELGLVVFFAGLVVANSAVLQMSRCLSEKTKGAVRIPWWGAIGNGGSFVISQYRQFGWTDQTPEKRLRFGYRLIFSGLAIAISASVVGKIIRGS